MLDCWQHSADLRPTFSQLVLQLEELLQSGQEYLDVEGDIETEKSRCEMPCLKYQQDMYLMPDTMPSNEEKINSSNLT